MGSVGGSNGALVAGSGNGGGGGDGESRNLSLKKIVISILHPPLIILLLIRM